MRTRPATSDDAQLLFEWANDPDTRRWSFSTDPIPWESHVEWLDRVLDDPDRQLYIGVQDGSVGVVRFDRDENGSEVSITVAPEHRGKGLSRPLLDAALAVYPHRPIIAQVKTENEASMRLFGDWQLDRVEDGVAVFTF